MSGDDHLKEMCVESDELFADEVNDALNLRQNALKWEVCFVGVSHVNAIHAALVSELTVECIHCYSLSFTRRLIQCFI